MKYTWRPLFALALAVSCPVSPTQAQSPTADAPIGLVWGSSQTEVQAKGIELKEIEGTDFGKSYLASKMDKALADQSAALLSFGFNDKLWRVLITSRPFSDDPAGSAISARYTELASLLSEKYGKGTQVHRLGESIYGQSGYFVAGIRGGQSKWFTNFDTPNLFIQLGLTASDSSTATWRLIYENKFFRRDFEASKRSREKGTL
ncbi:hypothetical protein [Bradyrhizobium sp. WSM471]|uniref:hypothetical protein n=1 Tax=Bradyrhizobium sp. WSM471 TaxID=319017 RepID=UPI00024D2019|nr:MULTISPECIES: hypothetical protein [Bradyrhizobium]EHR01238.1 hypothetical protein Bra471DRAFT_01940 [Bradyrhizobium sp. WSM471]UFW43302.1 hypothetical protein BcanWSM471_09550 [Bradyrhizobium canariense]